LCHGDTATAFSTALAAFYQKIPVGHVEAGLRTFDRYSPFPEEINRSLIGRIAQYHFCPTHRNRDNLTREKVGGEIFITGNTVIDAIHMTVLPGYKFHSAMFQRLLEPGKMIAVLTAHRRENLGVPLENICRAVLALSQRYPNLRVIYPVHPSPDVRDTVFPMLQGQAEIFLTPPIDTMDMHQLLARCHFVMTDSGGIQEEAPALGKPVLVLRKETERPEAIESGVALLAGVETDRIVDLASQIIDDTSLYERMAEAANPYGDGNAARRIVEYLLWTTKRSSEQPMPFEHIGYRG
jgi:UDP-N-acetylglucosamine 2-epimerase